MSTAALFVNALLGMAALAVPVTTIFPAAAEDAKLQTDLRSLAQKRVYFGHQSVGFNILDGLRDLSAQYKIPLRIVDSAPGGVPPQSLAHGLVAENGDPRRKLRSFEEAFESTAASGADVALLKYCYVDIERDTDVSALFADYQKTMARLRQAHPKTTFVHVTAPLTTLQGGAKGFVKRLLGRPPNGLLANARRDQYSSLIRKAYQGREPILDIARIESTWPDGHLETVDWEGSSIPVLVSAYTDDGGHLNTEGRRRVAAALAAAVALAGTLPEGGTTTAPARANLPR